ncbi:hypothetical protein J437_LFUL009206 [Ladona fulva]|uniref:Gem-associated protein 2 n=1 Tax=Ladona fulva TaxID=123851 RepID=A0A8K0K811_LADFU|nr:hypothetical protein J437_LFUL009206 [Ladona fulva]
MSDNEYEELRKKALIVEEISVDFDSSVPPSTGQEYIQRVVLEAARCDDVVYAKVDQNRISKQTFILNNLPGCVAAPSEFAPSKEWQQLQVANFSRMRQKLDRYRKKTIKEPPPVKLPKERYAEDWYQMCFGRFVDSENKGPEYARAPPLLSIVTAMPNLVIEKVLEYEVQWLSEEDCTFSHEDGQWLYALLAALELPLTPDTCALLRNLARCCSQLRAKLDSSNHSLVAAYNLFICLVAKYFRQSDLADN